MLVITFTKNVFLLDVFYIFLHFFLYCVIRQRLEEWKSEKLKRKQDEQKNMYVAIKFSVYHLWLFCQLKNEYRDYVMELSVDKIYILK